MHRSCGLGENVRATTGQNKLKRVTANSKSASARDENLRWENIEPENHLIRSVFAALALARCKALKYSSGLLGF
jgi:hypothetical protein